MKLREPEKQILDDFEHKVTGKIAKYGNEPDFPKFENYGITRMELDDYLFDKQAILDMGGSKRSQLTIGGFITVLPVLYCPVSRISHPSTTTARCSPRS